jgi:hypothetical protein
MAGKINNKTYPIFIQKQYITFCQFFPKGTEIDFAENKKENEQIQRYNPWR